MLQDRRRELQVLRTKRSELLERLNALLKAREKQQEQSSEREHVVAALQRSRTAALVAQDQLHNARAQCEALTQANAQRKARLERLQAQLLGSRTELLNNHFPHLLRYQSLTYQHVSSMLLHEQKLRLKQVLDILPLRVEGGGLLSGEAGPQLSICGLRVAEQAVQLLDGRIAPESSSAALGYTLLLLDLLGTYLGGPLLHEGSFQASTTVVWQQQSFWNRRPASSSCVLPLFVEDVPQSNILLPATKPSGSAWTLGGLMRAGMAMDVAQGGRRSMDEMRQDSLEDPGSLRGSKYADMQAAHSMLQRSISCFVRELVALVPGVQLPASWGAMSWLAMLCALYHRDPRIEVLVQAAQQLAETAAAAAAAPAGFAPASSPTSACLPAPSADTQLGLAQGGRRETVERQDGEEGVEDWDVLLPPKPSESDAELEHWTQAMLPSRGG